MCTFSCINVFAFFCSTLQRVATRCSMLQYIALCCSALQCAAVHCSVLQCIAVRCIALQCDAVRCSALQFAATCSNCNKMQEMRFLNMLQKFGRPPSEYAADVFAGILPSLFKSHCNTLQHTATRCNIVKTLLLSFK